jgi:NTP pyrophosphatase (non-canonical NTP hydrolase)
LGAEEVSGYSVIPLTFVEVSDINRQRAGRWHQGFPDGPWNSADWGCALAGEAGEACNVIKKLRRLETGSDQGIDDGTKEELIEDLADEIADTFLYLDLLASYHDISLPGAICSKFNRISVRQGFPERLPSQVGATLKDVVEELEQLRAENQRLWESVTLMPELVEALRSHVTPLDGESQDDFRALCHARTEISRALLVRYDDRFKRKVHGGTQS